MLKRITIGVEEKLLNRADDFAKRYGLNRSTLISVALNEYMFAKDKEPEVMEAINKLGGTLEQLLKEKQLKD